MLGLRYSFNFAIFSGLLFILLIIDAFLVCCSLFFVVFGLFLVGVVSCYFVTRLNSMRQT